MYTSVHLQIDCINQKLTRKKKEEEGEAEEEEELHLDWMHAGIQSFYLDFLESLSNLVLHLNRWQGDRGRNVTPATPIC